jgi:transcriptional regulator with XRE-family HTH domain
VTEERKRLVIEAGRVKLALSHVLLAELESQDITVYELAKRAGLPDDTVRDYTAAVSEPSLSRLLAIERGLDRPAGWLAEQVAKRRAK